MCQHDPSEVRWYVYEGRKRRRCLVCEREYKRGLIRTKPRPKPVTLEVPIYRELARRPW